MGDRLSERHRFRWELRCPRRSRGFFDGEGVAFEVLATTTAHDLEALRRQAGFMKVPSTLTGSQDSQMLAAKK